MIEQTLKDAVSNNWPMLLIFTVVIVTIRITYLVVHKDKFVLYKELFMLAFLIYAMLLFYVVTFQDVNYGTNNFIPFKEIRRFYIYRDVVGIRAFLANLFGNVLAFMPFGFFMPILRLRLRKWYCMLGMTFLLSLMIEITQLLTRVGSFDVDDLILNTSGGILGYLLFYIINKVRRKWNGA